MKTGESLRRSITIINTMVRLIREGNYVFRGTSRRNEILPKINRVYDNGVIRDLSLFESKLLYDFQRFTTSYIQGSLGTIDTVAYAQHFGLPTRLIDWTGDPFVALFFAINSNDNPDDGIYKLFYTRLDENIVISRDYIPLVSTSYSLNLPEKWSLFVKSIKNKEKLVERILGGSEKYSNRSINNISTNGLIFYDSALSNPRLIAQQGLFSLPVSIEGLDAKKEVESVAKYFEIEITPKERLELLQYLSNMNYNHLRLFPDIENACGYITNLILKNEK